MNSSYIKTGKCIWCGRQEPEVTFHTAPHIVPRSLGGKEIGFDVCDDCNHAFGSSPKAGMPSIDLAFKEIFNAFKIFGGELNTNTHKKYPSVFFNYWHSKHIIKINRNFDSTKITKQFKRGLYEVFLQKYHYVTGNGNHPMFQSIRDFARYGIGDLHVFYAFNNILLSPKDKSFLKILMNDKIIEEMMESGIYFFWMTGHIFFLEILPLAFKTKGSAYLQNKADTILFPALGDEQIIELTDVMQTDFLMQRFNNKLMDY